MLAIVPSLTGMEILQPPRLQAPANVRQGRGRASSWARGAGPADLHSHPLRAPHGRPRAVHSCALRGSWVYTRRW